jgi:ATP-dependent DNA helicase HFM1/MER3
LLTDDSITNLDGDWNTLINNTSNNTFSKSLKSAPDKANNSNNNMKKVSVMELPERYRSIFMFEYFNPMQSESFFTVFKTGQDCVISSPTGSGKTVLFELSIIKLLVEKLNGSDHTVRNAKILYMAPTKALCSEKYNDWCKKFQPLGCSVGLLTGDSSFMELDNIKRSDLIICTPEKWDSLTRRWSDYSKLLDLVKLLLVDEVHFIRELRGSSLEVVITRMITMSLNLRIIALSATVPNIKDISKWLGNGSIDRNIKTFVFNDSYRAVNLKKTVYGYKTAGSNNPFQMEGYYNSKLSEVIRLHSKNKPVLIFCPTRNSTTTTAKFLTQDNHTLQNNKLNLPSGISRDISELIENGIAYHHAGLSQVERKFIEDSFISGRIKILCSTSTLAVGVNLPAYLVIIKGTKVWNNECIKEYSELDLMQMMGRAGRPQFETEGACVIMTDITQKDRYIRLVEGTEKLESSLHLNMHENITAEITLKTIRSLETAFTWLQSTFFYQRCLQSPTAYPKIFSQMSSDCSLDIQLKIFLKNIIDELVEENIIELIGGEYISTAYGDALSKSYVLYETIKLFIKAKPKLEIQELLLLVSKSNEFSNLRLKTTQKKLYKEINENPLIFHKLDNKKLENFGDKVALLIQFELGGIEYPLFQGSKKLHYEFLSEKTMVFKNIPRILKAVIEIFSFKKDAVSLSAVLKLNRCIFAKSWENSSLVLRQFEGIGLSYAKKLMIKGINSIEKAKSLPREKLEYYIGSKPGACQKIIKSIINMPELNLKIEDIVCKSNGFVQFNVIVDLINEIGKVNYVWNGSFVYINVLTDFSGDILDFRRLPLKKLHGGKHFKLKTQLRYKTDYIKISLNCDQIAGIGKQIQLDLSNATTFLPRKNKKITQEIIERSSSFEFDAADDEILNIMLDKDEEVEKTKKKDVDTKFDTNIHMISENSDLSGSFDISFRTCLHKCNEKLKCRHVCCKEGIPKPKNKICKHLCKDKSQCRHLCCREQFEYKQKKDVKNDKKMKQDTLDFSFNQIKKSNESTFFEEINNVDDKEEIITKSNVNSSNMPVFFRRVEKNVPTSKVNPDICLNASAENTAEIKEKSDLKLNKLTNSKYFKLTTGSVSKPKMCLLDDSDSDIFSDSFDEALEKVFKDPKKRIKPTTKKQEAKRRHKENVDLHKVTNIVESIKVNNQMNKLENKFKDSSQTVDCVEDIVIINQNLPKVLPMPHTFIDKPRAIKQAAITKIAEDESIIEDSFNSSSNQVDEMINDHSIMTSVYEDFCSNKDALNFLGSDVEFSD